MQLKEPSKVDLNNLFEHFKSGNYDEAEKLAIIITEKFPNHSFSWKILGVIFSLTERLEQSFDGPDLSAACHGRHFHTDWTSIRGRRSAGTNPGFCGSPDLLRA